jgi:uncharacterized protein
MGATDEPGNTEGYRSDNHGRTRGNNHGRTQKNTERSVCFRVLPWSKAVCFRVFPWPKTVCFRVLPWFVLSVLLCGTVAAQPAPPRLTAPVNDFAHVIDPEHSAELDRRIRALETASGDVVVVATVPTFKPYGDINEYAVKMVENGGKGIGQRGKDNGALIVVAVDDHAIRIEVGYDLEQFITDGFAGETIRALITPAFRSGAYGEGLLAGTTRVINRIAEARGVTLQDVPAEPRRATRPGSSFPVGTIIFIIAMVIILSRRGSGRRGFWGGGPWSGWSSGVGPFGGGFGGGFGGFGGGGGGGGFGGFGGGGSGGGGASGSW